MKTSTCPLLTVVVPSRGGMSELLQSAPPLLADTRVQYLLVDSGRYGCPGHVARGRWPTARVVDLPGSHPVDPGQAVAAGARAAGTEWVAVLGPEVVVSERFVPAAVERLAEGVFLSDEGAVIVGPRGAIARASEDDGAFGSDLARRLEAMGLRRVTLPPGLFLGPGEFHPSRGTEVCFPDPVTIGIAGSGLGDRIKTVAYACWVREAFGVEVSLYPNWHGYRGRDFAPEPLDRFEAGVREILDLLDLPWRIPVEPVASIEEVFVPDQFPWHFPLTATSRMRWRGWGGGLHRRIAYQIDGRSRGSEKNPPPEDIPRLLGWASGFEMVPLGKHMSLWECAEAAARSDLFFGVDSGMAQLCYAVGVPVFVIGWNDRLVQFKWHGDRHAIHCADTADFVSKARQFLGLAAG